MEEVDNFNQQKCQSVESNILMVDVYDGVFKRAKSIRRFGMQGGRLDTRINLGHEGTTLPLVG